MHATKNSCATGILLMLASISISMAPLLEVRNLVKEYPEVQAVDKIGFEAQKGSC